MTKCATPYPSTGQHNHQQSQVVLLLNMERKPPRIRAATEELVNFIGLCAIFYVWLTSIDLLRRSVNWWLSVGDVIHFIAVVDSFQPVYFLGTAETTKTLVLFVKYNSTYSRMDQSHCTHRTRFVP